MLPTPRALPQVVSLLCLVVAVGCAHDAPGSRADFSLSGSGNETSARVTDHGIVGPQLDVGRYEEGKTFRGTAFGQPVDIGVTGRSARGTAGRGLFELEVRDTGRGAFTVEGLLRGVPSSFTVSPEAVTGTIGHCAYDLRRSGADYTGDRACARGPVTVRLTLPSTVSSWSSVDLAVLMALLMTEP